MKPISRPLKRVLLVASLLLLALILAAGYIAVQALGKVDSVKVAGPNSVESEDANRKMRRFEGSLKSGQPGYIRLSETELNALLENRFSPGLKAGQAEPPADGPQLMRALAGLGEEEMTWHYWVRVPWAGREFRFVLRHKVRLGRENEQWKFETLAMHLGRLAIPQRYWSKIEPPSGSGQNELSKPYQWLLNLPALDLATNEFNRMPELVLYNYPAPEVIKKYKP